MSKFFQVILFAIIGLTGKSLSQPNDIVVTTDSGKIRGIYMTSRMGEIFYAFRGIRYAKPPLGELRFKAPEPVQRWNEIFDATEDGPMCPQRNGNLSDVSEDCLRLNVYTRLIPTNSTSHIRKPVIIYLHPGGFYSVSGQSKNFAGPQSLMDRDIVLVTLNYRLGSLGFLATGTAEAPGNAGLKDQVMAMKWVQSQISHFGGDPNSVTLVGYSAGAMSVTLHMISPMSQNLFHKAVVMSGSAAAQWEIPTHQVNLAKRQAELFQCPTGNISEMIDCLRRQDAIEYGLRLAEMFEFGSGNPIILWKPVIEPDFGQERFLTEDPLRTYKEGKFMKIPVIAGITKDEFARPAAGVLLNATLTELMNNNFNKFAPICFLYERDTKRSENISHCLDESYLKNRPLNLNSSLEGLAELFSDGVIGFGMHRFARLIAGQTRVYFYRHSFQGRYSHFYYPADKPYGVVHHDDLLYLIVAPGVAPMFTERDPEHLNVERMTRMWSAFAHNGNPNLPHDEYLREIQWTPFTLENGEYLDINNISAMKQNLYLSRYQVWERLFLLD